MTGGGVWGTSPTHPQSVVTKVPDASSQTGQLNTGLMSCASQCAVVSKASSAAAFCSPPFLPRCRADMGLRGEIKGRAALYLWTLLGAWMSPPLPTLHTQDTCLAAFPLRPTASTHPGTSDPRNSHQLRISFTNATFPSERFAESSPTGTL